MTTKAKIPQQNPVLDVFERASDASPYHVHTTPGFDEAKLIPQNPAARTMLDLSRNLVIPAELEYLLGLTTSNGGNLPVYTPDYTAIRPGDTTVIDPLEVIRANSRAARAGASILVAQEPPARVQEGLTVMFDQDALFRGVDPAPFALVADGAAAANSALPVNDALYSWSACPTYGYTVQITRRQLKSVGGDGLRAAIMIAVLKGLGELADSLVLNAILAAQPANPSAFNLGAFAARHATFGELRALVGRNGSGATVDMAGNLRAGGVLAELTAVTDKTVAGRFVRSAIALKGEVAVHGIRQGADGSVQVSCFANMQPVIQDAAGDFAVVTA